MRQVIHHGGQTTIADAAIGMYGLEKEWDHLVAVMEQPDTRDMGDCSGVAD